MDPHVTTGVQLGCEARERGYDHHADIVWALLLLGWIYDDFDLKVFHCPAANQAMISTRSLQFTIALDQLQPSAQTMLDTATKVHTMPIGFRTPAGRLPLAPDPAYLERFGAVLLPLACPSRLALVPQVLRMTAAGYSVFNAIEPHVCMPDTPRVYQQPLMA